VFAGANHPVGDSQPLPVELQSPPLKGVSMTLENEERIRALSQLLANEQDRVKIGMLADELGRLLTLPRKPQLLDEKPLAASPEGVLDRDNVQALERAK
jgi:hypothetical protein